MKSRKIVVLFHEKTNPLIARRYTIARMARFWRQDGHRVKFLYGTHRFHPADICVVHVDLSVVPEEYLEFAGRYPVALNRGVRDVRKSAVSRNLLHRGDRFRGPVVVKTDLNYAGWPEILVEKSLPVLIWLKVCRKLNLADSAFYAPEDYPLFDSLDDVPNSLLDDSRYVVEKFLPERHDDLYYTNIYVFVGQSYHCLRLGSPDWVVNTTTNCSMEMVEPHPEIVRLRHAMGFDFGKFDYCIHNGEPILFDTNKTIGMSNWAYTPEINAMVRARGEGLYGYF